MEPDVRENVPVEQTGIHERPGQRPPMMVRTTPELVFHHSEDPTIRRFAPHVPQTNPSQPPSVWAIDLEHSPLYWFPRDCARISVWAYNDAQQRLLTDTFGTDASRICAAESRWLTRVRDAVVYRYAFDGAQFAPWADADGQYVSHQTAYPQKVEALDDLLRMHAEAEIDLRFIPRLGPLMDKMLASGLPFSFVRIRNAKT